MQKWAFEKRANVNKKSVRGYKWPANVQINEKKGTHWPEQTWNGIWFIIEWKTRNVPLNVVSKLWTLIIIAFLIIAASFSIVKNDLSAYMSWNYSCSQAFSLWYFAILVKRKQTKDANEIYEERLKEFLCELLNKGRICAAFCVSGSL